MANFSRTNASAYNSLIYTQTTDQQVEKRATLRTSASSAQNKPVGNSARHMFILYRSTVRMESREELVTFTPCSHAVMHIYITLGAKQNFFCIGATKLVIV
jgi:hypothetical protein